MSLDYPFYEELRRRKHRAAKWWKLGDCLYYVGLLGTILLFMIKFVLSIVAHFCDWSSRVTVYSGIAMIIGIVLFFSGVSLKRLSYTMARRDGIDVDDY